MNGLHVENLSTLCKMGGIRNVRSGDGPVKTQTVLILVSQTGTYCSISVHMLSIFSIYQSENCRYPWETIADDPIVNVETAELFLFEAEEEDKHYINGSSACLEGVCLHEPFELC